MDGVELVVAVAALMTALGVKEWVIGKQSQKSGEAQLELTRYKQTVQDRIDAETRLEKCEALLSDLRDENYKEAIQSKSDILWRDEYIAKLRIALIEAGIDIPER